MGKIRLPAIKKGQVFFEWDGPYVSKMVAVEDARLAGSGLPPGHYCKCRVIEGLAAGDLVELYERPDLEPGSDLEVKLYDRIHLDMPPIRHRFRQ